MLDNCLYFSRGLFFLAERDETYSPANWHSNFPASIKTLRVADAYFVSKESLTNFSKQILTKKHFIDDCL